MQWYHAYRGTFTQAGAKRDGNYEPRRAVKALESAITSFAYQNYTALSAHDFDEVDETIY